MHRFPTLRHAAAIALVCAAGAAAAIQADEVTADDHETVAELIGDLMFHADLMTSLDRMCPRGGSAPDWHAALPALPPEATTPELLELSSRLGTDAGQRMLRENGGCATRGFEEAYDESRQTFAELIERWRRW